MEAEEISILKAHHLTMGFKRSNKTWNARPQHWAEIASYYAIYGEERTIVRYQDDLMKLNFSARAQALKAWSKDFANGISSRDGYTKARKPAIGTLLDIRIAERINERINQGLAVNDTILHEIAIDIAELGGRGHLLAKNGGSLTLGASWCKRFWARHNLTTRTPTTKMREIPVDLQEKDRVYLQVLSRAIAKYNIPPVLRGGCDETNTQFVSVMSRTKAKRGSKRIRLLGVGHEKTQITVMITVMEERVGNPNESEILPPQLIFEGTTKKCHPKESTIPGDDWLISHTKSHWQTPISMAEYLKGIFFPYKNRIICELNLPADQWTLLKLDLHYSHHDEAIKALCSENRVVLVYVPAGCTDIRQECDTVVNKPYKNGVRTEFTRILHDQFEAFQGEKSMWQPNLKMSALKPLMGRLVDAGLRSIKTPAMRQTIRQAFINDGLFGLATSPEMQHQALEDLRNMNEENTPDMVSLSHTHS